MCSSMLEINLLRKTPTAFRQSAHAAHSSHPYALPCCHDSTLFRYIGLLDIAFTLL